MTARHRRLGAAFWLFVAVLAGFLCVQRGAVTARDGARLVAVSRSIVEDGDLSIDASIGVPGRDGEHYSKYGIGQSLVLVPAVAIGRGFGAVVGHQDDVVDLAAASMMPVIAAGLVVALFALGQALGGSRRASLLVAIGAMVGTFALPYGKDSFSELLTALAITIAIERGVRGRPAEAGAAVAAAVLVRPQSMVLAGLWVAWALWTWRRQALTAISWVAAGVIAAALHNWIRFDSFTETGYFSEGFTTPVLDGLRILVLEQRKSVLLFAPVVVIVPVALYALHRRLPAAAGLLAGNLLVTILLTAVWHIPGGGYSWGPRLLLPGLLPAIAALAPWSTVDRTRARTVALLYGLGFVVSASTLIVPPQAQQLDANGGSSPRIIRQYELIPDVVEYSIEHRDDRSERGVGEGRHFVDVWPVMAGRVLGTEAIIGGFVGMAALAAVTVVAGRRAWRLAGDPTPTT